jgi:arylsulfatase A-like enzyme
MPDKKVVYLALAAVLAAAQCRKPPETDFHIVRLADRLDSKAVVASPFGPGRLDPADAANFPVRVRPFRDLGSGPDPLGLRKKLYHDGADSNVIMAPPGSRYTFEVDLPKNAFLEFGTGIVRDENSETARKKAASTEDGVRFRVLLEVGGRAKTIFLGTIDQPPLVDGRGFRNKPEALPLPASGEKSRLTLSTEGPEGAFAFWTDPVVISAGARSRKIILVSIDTLRADHVGCYGYGKATTPALDALASDSAVFLDTYAPSSWTLPSHVSLLTSLSCFRHGVNREDDRMSSTTVTLADVLRTRGFVCAAVTGGGFVSPVFGFSKGFDSYLQAEGSPWTSRGAGQVFSAASQWIDKNAKKDFFLFVHTYQPHSPYIPPPPEDSMFLDPDAPWRMIDVGSHVGGPWGLYKRLPDAESRAIAGLYDGEIRYSDDALIGPLVAKLKALGIYDEAMIIVTSDHGEEFYDHGGWEHGRSLYDEVLKVPLVVKFPRSEFRGRRVPTAVRLIDVMPTVMDVFGATPEGLGLEGRTLLPVLNGREKKDRMALAFLAGGVLESPIGEKMSAIEGRDKVILNKPKDPGLVGTFLAPPPPFVDVEAYDIAADPREKTNIVSGRAALASRLAALLKGLRAGAAAKKGDKALIDDELKERLKALGYVH